MLWTMMHKLGWGGLLMALPVPEDSSSKARITLRTKKIGCTYYLIFLAVALMSVSKQWGLCQNDQQLVTFGRYLLNVKADSFI